MPRETRAFTIRLPPELEDQISARAKLNRRTKNAEIEMMLEAALDQSAKEELNRAQSAD